jgi:hypothetical protein
VTSRVGRCGTDPRPGLVALWGAGLLVALGYLAAADPDDPAALMPRCPTRAITGLECPGCGGLRMVSSLLRGDLRRAASANGFLLAASPVLSYFLYRWARAVATGTEYRPPVRLARLLGAGAVAWAVARNAHRLARSPALSG